MISIRPAKQSDAQTLYNLILEIADYERLAHEVENTKQRIENEFFSANPKVFALIIESDSVPIGYAIYYYNYSTFVGKHGLYLEDFYIQEAFRRAGIGKKVFDYLIQICQQENLGRMEWMVLKWNQSAISFYEQYEPAVLDEWHFMRLNEQQIKNRKV